MDTKTKHTHPPSYAVLILCTLHIFNLLTKYENNNYRSENP